MTELDERFIKAPPLGVLAVAVGVGDKVVQIWIVTTHYICHEDIFGV